MGFIEDNLKKKRLTFYDFSSDIPDDLHRLTRLEELTFNQAARIPESIGQLKHLKRLTIQSDTFEALPDSIGQLSSLTMLTIECPQLKTLPDLTVEWPNLTYLNIKSDQLATIPASYQQCSQLDFVSLKIGAAISLTGLEAFANLPQLNLSLEAPGLLEFPRSLLALDQLRQLTLTATLKALPSDFGVLTGLERLSLYMEELERLPDSFGTLARLWELNLYTRELKTLPSSMAALKVTALSMRSHFTTIPSVVFEMKSLQSLGINESNISTLPEEIAQLEHITALYFQRNSLLTTLPAGIGQLQHLTSLVVSNNALQELPNVFDQWAKLTTLQIDNNQIATLPATLATLKEPLTFFYENNPLGRIHPVHFDLNLKDAYYTPGYKNSEELIKYLTETKKKGALPIHYSTLCAVFEASINHRKGIEKAYAPLEHYDFKALLSVYVLVTGLFRANLVEYLMADGETKLQEAAPEQPVLAIAGTINLKKTAVKTALKESPIQYASKVNAATNIIILGNNIKNIEALLLCDQPIFLKERSLNELVETLRQPYLLASSDTETKALQQNVVDLLLNKKEENIKIGLELLDGGGVPEETLAILFALHKMHPDKKIATKAKKLLLTKASDLLKERNKIRVSWRKSSKDNFLQRHDFWQIVKETELEKDIWKIALGAYWWQGSTTAIAQDLQYMPKELLPELIAAYAKNHMQYETMRVRSVSKMLFLEQLYPYMKNCKELVLELQQLENPVLPSGIAQLTQLTRLTLEYKYREYEAALDASKVLVLPADIGKASALQKLFLESTDGWHNLPKNIEQATQINTLNITLDLSNRIDARRLRALTGMKYFIFKFSKVEWEYLQLFLVQLPAVPKFSIQYTHEDKAAHFGSLQQLLKGYTLTQNEWRITAVRD
ncbi:MAG: hypothetical protein ACRBFS_04345 [Aureispira sp.]